MKLRPHHILCIAHYEGKGYSEKFNAKMKEIIKRLDSGEGFTPVFGADDLCAACPHNADGVCDAEEKTARYDKTVAELIGLKPGKRYFKNEIADKAQNGIYAKNRFTSVCSDCEWANICHNR